MQRENSLSKGIGQWLYPYKKRSFGGRRAGQLLLPIILPAVFLLFWHHHAQVINNPLKLPQISQVLSILLHPDDNIIGVGSIWKNTYVSLMRVLLGYLVALVAAIPLGIIIGYSRIGEKLLLPFLSLFRSIPPMAWVPLVLAWCGIASLASIFEVSVRNPNYLLLNNLRFSMIIIIFLGAFFPILSNVIYGIRSVQKTFVNAACSMGASKFQLITKIYFPHAFPSIFTGMQISLGTAWMCLICAEMLPGSIAGAGYMISHAYQLTRIDVVIAGMIAISIVGTILDAIFVIISRYCFKWQYHGA